MTQNSNLVFRGYIKLSRQEQLEVIDALNEYEKAQTELKKSIKEGIEKTAAGIYLGPVGGACPCCGRS